MEAAIPSTSQDNAGGAAAVLPKPAVPSAARGLLRLFVEGVLLLLCAYATVAAFVLFVPEVNDYHRASAMKHERLAALPAPKIVLAGGSNLAFGIDSAMIEAATGRKVVNMGMDGFLGVRFLLAEVEPYVKASDLVVIALEHDSYVIPIEGNPDNQLAIVKANPGALEYLTTQQKLAILKASHVVAHAKVDRLIVDFSQTVQQKLLGIESKSQLAEHVGSFAGFNAQGDLTSHLDIRYPGKPMDGMDLRRAAIEPVARLMHEFEQRMQKRNVTVMFSYPPVAEPYFKRYRKNIESIDAALRSEPGAHVPSRPDTFELPEDLFFDTVYHVRREGRAIRTRKLVDDIRATLAETTATGQ
jgi:hypothetical protein